MASTKRDSKAYRLDSLTSKLNLDLSFPKSDLTVCVSGYLASVDEEFANDMHYKKLASTIATIALSRIVRHEGINYRNAQEAINKYIYVLTTKGDVVMGDIYKAGQAGAQGPGSHAENMTFNQIWNENSSEIDLRQLAEDLFKLRSFMSKEDLSAPERAIALGSIAQAEKAAKEGDGPGAIEKLKSAGAWGVECATKIGTAVAAKAIEVALGL